MDIIDRREHIRKIIEGKISELGADNAYRKDAQYHAQMYQFIDNMTKVDEVLENEGVSQEIRNKVIDDCFFTGSSDYIFADARQRKWDEFMHSKGWDWKW